MDQEDFIQYEVGADIATRGMAVPYVPVSNRPLTVLCPHTLCVKYGTKPHCKGTERLNHNHCDFKISLGGRV